MRFLEEDAPMEGSIPKFPINMTHSPTSLNLEYPSTRNILYSEQDVMITVIYLDEAWSETGLYVRRHGFFGSLPPWSIKSEYSRRMS